MPQVHIFPKWALFRRLAGWNRAQFGKGKAAANSQVPAATVHLCVTVHPLCDSSPHYVACQHPHLSRRSAGDGRHAVVSRNGCAPSLPTAPPADVRAGSAGSAVPSDMQVPPPLGGCDAAFHAARDEMEALRLRSRRTAIAAEQVPPPVPLSIPLHPGASRLHALW